MNMNKNKRQKQQHRFNFGFKKKQEYKKQNTLQWIEQIKYNFQTKVQKPIQHYQQGMKKALLQRCLAHNIMYSLYCTVCKQLICASCMYKNSQHRKHHVVPQEKALEDIKQDIKLAQNRVLKAESQYSTLSNLNTTSLHTIDGSYNKIKSQLQQFYAKLTKTIKNAQKQQLAILKNWHESIIQEVKLFEKEVSKIYNYISQKYKTYSIANLREGLIIPAKLILEKLLLTPTLIKNIQNQPIKTSFNIDYDKMHDYPDEILYKLNSIIPNFQNKIRANRNGLISPISNKKKSSQKSSKRSKTVMIDLSQHYPNYFKSTSNNRK